MEVPVIIRAPVSQAEILEIAKKDFGDMVKIVVDIGRGILAAGGGLHADAEELLIEDGSSQEDLWGANYYPEREDGKKLEYSAMINIRPARGNRSQEIQSGKVKDSVKAVVERLLGDS